MGFASVQEHIQESKKQKIFMQIIVGVGVGVVGG